MTSGLQSRITATMWVMTVVSTITAAILGGMLTIRSHRNSIREQLQAATTALMSVGISKATELNDFDKLDAVIANTLQMERVNKVARIYDISGKLVYSTVGLKHDDLPTRLPAGITRPEFLAISGGQQKYESLIVPYFWKNRKLPHYLQVAIPLPRIEDLAKTLWWQTLLFLLLLTGIALVLSRWLARRLLKPVENVGEYLTRLEPSRMLAWEQIELGSDNRYLGAIIRGINGLVSRTKTALLQVQQMSRYVAHELRTPLTILLGEAESALNRPQSSKEDYEGVLRSSIDEIHRMSDIVTTILKLGEREQAMLDGAVTTAIPYAIDQWVGENRVRWERTLGRAVRLEIRAKARIVADCDLLFRMMDNLVRNVRDHAQTGGTISLDCANGTAMLSVEDDGPGIPPRMLETLNGDGASAAASRVGLHLCFRIAELLGARLQFEPKRPHGLRVTISIPCDREERAAISAPAPERKIKLAR